jgi:hypothetical protein
MSNEGFRYEDKINSLLKESTLQPKEFAGAKADSNAPDAIITLNGKKYKVEIKLDLNVDFGQGSLNYDLEKDEWVLGGANTGAAEQMREFLTKIGAIDRINSTAGWGGQGAPRKYTVPLNKFTQKDVTYDYTRFRDRFIIVNSNAVSNYYASKDTHYIQIGKYGLYYMKTDPAKLGVPKFNPNLRLRIRLKRGGSSPIYNYRFTTALQATSLAKSDINLENKEDLEAIAARHNNKG